MSDGQDRTEKATPERMKEVRRKGELQRSQDMSAWIGLAAAAIALPAVLAGGQSAAIAQLGAVRAVAAAPSIDIAVRALDDGTRSLLGTLAPMFALVVLVTVAAAAAQGGIHPSRIRLHAKQLNVLAGIKRLFTAQTWWQAVKTIVKSGVVGLVLYQGIEALVPLMASTGRVTLPQLLGVAAAGATTLLRGGIGAGIVLALLDVIVVIRNNRKRTRMTLREVKDENKKSEGDPLLKGAIRSRQLAMSRNRMMAAVATADVVLVNPTHVAVALRYEPGSGAPRVVAKGAGAVATRIRAEAAEKRVPMVEDVPLARALHSACELGDEVPSYLYTAVARILAFVMALRRRGSALGQHRLPTGPTELPPEAATPRTRPRTRARPRTRTPRP